MSKKHFNEKNNASQKALSMYQFWVTGDLMVNYMEMQDFVELPCITSLRYTWNDTDNVLENCENVLEKSLKSAWIFFWKHALTMYD